MKPSRVPMGDFINQNTTPRFVFACGALLFPAFLLQTDIAIRALEIVLFTALNALAGRRIRILPPLILALGIVIFHLIIPTGKVLTSILGLPITESALKTGLYKATAVTGLIALSQFSLRSELELPGRLGSLIGRALFYFERIMGERKRIDRANIIGSIDDLLIEIQGARPARKSAKAISRTTLWGGAALAFILAVAWAALALCLAHPRLIYGI